MEEVKIISFGKIGSKALVLILFYLRQRRPNQISIHANMLTEDERLARELQAQFEAEALAADEDNRSIDKNIEHSRTANWRSSGATELTDWSDDHMTDEQLAAMLESMQVSETGRGSPPPSDRFALLSRRQSDGRSSALARQLYEEEMQLARQMEEDERMAREISSESVTSNTVEAPRTRRCRATQPGVVSVKPTIRRPVTGPVVVGVDPNANSVITPANRRSHERPQNCNRRNPRPVNIDRADSLLGIDNIGLNLPCSSARHQERRSPRSTLTKKPALLSMFGAHKKQSSLVNS